jgi:hypothetical protein
LEKLDIESETESAKEEREVVIINPVGLEAGVKRLILKSSKLIRIFHEQRESREEVTESEQNQRFILVCLLSMQRRMINTAALGG